MHVADTSENYRPNSEDPMSACNVPLGPEKAARAKVQIPRMHAVYTCVNENLANGPSFSFRSIQQTDRQTASQPASQPGRLIDRQTDRRYLLTYKILQTCMDAYTGTCLHTCVCR